MFNIRHLEVIFVKGIQDSAQPNTLLLRLVVFEIVFLIIFMCIRYIILSARNSFTFAHTYSVIADEGRRKHTTDAYTKLQKKHNGIT